MHYQHEISCRKIKAGQKKLIPIYVVEPRDYPAFELFEGGYFDSANLLIKRITFEYI